MADPTVRDNQIAASTPALDFGTLWERTNGPMLPGSQLTDLIHDAEIDAGMEDGDCRLSLQTYHDGLVRALRELEARRHAGA